MISLELMLETLPADSRKRIAREVDRLIEQERADISKKVFRVRYENTIQVRAADENNAANLAQDLVFRQPGEKITILEITKFARGAMHKLMES
jgi:hypothetical protein